MSPKDMKIRYILEAIKPTDVILDINLQHHEIGKCF